MGSFSRGTSYPIGIYYLHLQATRPDDGFKGLVLESTRVVGGLPPCVPKHS